jgi:hypothetical protein
LSVLLSRVQNLFEGVNLSSEWVVDVGDQVSDVTLNNFKSLAESLSYISKVDSLIWLDIHSEGLHPNGLEDGVSLCVLSEDHIELHVFSHSFHSLTKRIKFEV